MLCKTEYRKRSRFLPLYYDGKLKVILGLDPGIQCLLPLSWHVFYSESVEPFRVSPPEAADQLLDLPISRYV